MYKGWVSQLTNGIGIPIMTRSVTKPVIQNAISTCKKKAHCDISEIGFQMATAITLQHRRVARKNAIAHMMTNMTRPKSNWLKTLFTEKMRR